VFSTFSVSRLFAFSLGRPKKRFLDVLAVIQKFIKHLNGLVKRVVGVAGFEPATPTSRTRRASGRALSDQDFPVTSDYVCSRFTLTKLWPPQDPDGRVRPRMQMTMPDNKTVLVALTAIGS
jgi:hypothetical protein